VIKDLLASLPQRGTVRWIGLRPARRVTPVSVEAVEALFGKGLVGDRFSGNPQSKRQVTLIQAEHLQIMGQLLERGTIDPALLRRNIVVSGINLVALNGAKFSIGEAIFEGTGPCDPCSRMEEALGTGGFNAMRGHGGITARVIESGRIRVGDEVAMRAASRGKS
jgi:MOSC domain-containing protein YiiM